jgi:hypothetical protein
MFISAGYDVAHTRVPRAGRYVVMGTPRCNSASRVAVRASHLIGAGREMDQSASSYRLFSVAVPLVPGSSRRIWNTIPYSGVLTGASGACQDGTGQTSSIISSCLRGRVGGPDVKVTHQKRVLSADRPERASAISQRHSTWNKMRQCSPNRSGWWPKADPPISQGTRTATLHPHFG